MARSALLNVMVQAVLKAGRGLARDFGEVTAGLAGNDIASIRTGLASLADQANQRLQNDWKARIAGSSGQGARVSASALYSSEQQWEQIKSGLEGAAATMISQIRIEAVGREGALVSFSFTGDRAGLATELARRGVTLADPAHIDVRGEINCGRDVSIDVNCVFEERVELEDGVSIGPNCVLKNVVVRAGARLNAFCHVEGADIGPKSIVGPYARLRPGAQLGTDVHVGNFVEIKNSTIADHSKANHLAYVGDATVGSRVNIGAGTITCNYDGANKFRTVIEDDVFIGSDTQLVAPVTVGRGATLGAGTTLTADAPAGQLTISRVKQLTIPGWKRPVKQKKD